MAKLVNEHVQNMNRLLTSVQNIFPTCPKRYGMNVPDLVYHCWTNLTQKRFMHMAQRNITLKMCIFVNSEGFLAEVFHPWVRWEGPGSGFENSSGAGGGKSKWVGPSWAQVGGPTPGPSGWAQAGPTWVGPSRAQVGGPKPGPSGWAQDTQIWPPWD